jgi:hypothetical protein
MNYYFNFSDDRRTQSITMVRVLHHMVGFSFEEMMRYTQLSKEMLLDLLFEKIDIVDERTHKNLLLFYKLALKNQIKRGYRGYKSAAHRA